MRKFAFFLLLAARVSFGQSTVLSPEAEISVLTLGPWQGQVYTAFGHSAFRVYDPVNNINAAYNYGVFDFDQPNFYLNFARGHNVYLLGVFDYPRFEYTYIYYNRYIHEQVLNLTASQKQRLFDFLQWNALPENREYLYDYFFDNCATKIPEVVLSVFGDLIQFDGSYITTDYSFRELTDLYLQQQPWGDLGIDIGLGLPIDRRATPYEYMFLPEYVERGFAHASIMKNGIAEPLVKQTIITYESQPEEPIGTTITPLALFSILFVILALISFWDIRRRKLLILIDVVLFSIVGLVGLALLLLWLATDHKAAAMNLNLLWALPTHLVVVFALGRRRTWVMNYFLVIAIFNLALLIAWPFVPQQLHYALVPLVMGAAVRAYTQYRVRKLTSLPA